ncbi:MAG: hypothetical protein U0559_04800 [Anaerolineae bacterium]
MDGEKINNVMTALKTFVDQVKSDDERVGLIEFYSRSMSWRRSMS